MKTRTGVLLAQLGSPDAPTAPAVRRFLKEFLSDPRVIEIPRWKWWWILHLFILPLRPARSAALYRRVWTDKGSPLIQTTWEQARLLAEALKGEALVEAGMRYGNPSLGAALDRLLAAGADRILVLPLFPQYSATTTGSVFDAVASHLRHIRVVPALRFLQSFHAHAGYIKALVASSRESLGRLKTQVEKVIVSFHGIPLRYTEAGDVYGQHAEETARLLAAGLGLDASRWEICFQSRFGREPWLQPYLARRLEELARSGTRRVAVVCPGFTADCLETTDEVGREGARQFREAGGEELHLLPCLNANPVWIKALADLARQGLCDWI